MFMLVCFVYDIVPCQESTTPQLCRTAAAVGNTICVRSQMTDSRQHAESTMLQPCRTPAAIGNIIYVRVACPRYAAASCLLRFRRTAAVQPPSSNISLQLYARVAAVVVADCFSRSLRCSTRLYANTSRCCCFYCCFCQVSIDMPA